MKIYLFAFLFLSTQLFAQSAEPCRAQRVGDTLIVENQLFARKFLWNHGNLITTSIVDKKQRLSWNWSSKEPDAMFPGHKDATGEGELKVVQIKSQANQSDHLEVSVTAQMDGLQVKRIFQIYPNVAAITCTFYFRGRPSELWKSSSNRNAMNMKAIEATKDLNTGEGNVPIMDKLSFSGNHWQVSPVEFFDMTDRNNTLVKESKYHLYRLPGFLTGNILLMKELISGNSFFILKEAPCSNMQLANPGYDFLVKSGSVQTVGIGVLPEDISENEWVRGYGYTFGLGGKSELQTLHTLRAYQDSKRPRVAERDEMILMNTWGDRNKDAKISEKFILLELKRAAELGMTHFQIDDGWQLGRTVNSAFAGGSSDNIWKNDKYWTYNPERFPNDLTPVIHEAKKLGIKIGLWFSPSIDSSFKHWEKDAQALIRLHKQYDIRAFKIDFVQIDDKQAEVNFRRLLDTVLQGTDFKVTFNLDATAGRRNGYHFFNEYGNLFLENRYTDWTNYYPYWSLRNLWDLSRYVPAQNIQIEFLNKWRNQDKYPADDIFAPRNYSFDYLFATTMFAQPLAWFEATGLPQEAFTTSQLIKTYMQNRAKIHEGQIFPIGDQPSGRSWTGFQSIRSDHEGFILVFRENNMDATAVVKTWLPAHKTVKLRLVAGKGNGMVSKVLPDGSVIFEQPEPNSFALYEYELK